MQKPNIVEISTKERQAGKKAVQKLRADKQVPAVIYGPKVEENVNVSLTEVDVEKLLSRSTTQIVKLDVEGHGTYDVLLKRVDFDKISDRPIHVDLYSLDDESPVIITVPIRLKGTARGVTEGGGRLYQPLRKIRIQCLPKNLPAEFTLDVSKLKIGDSLNVEDLVMEGITPLRELFRTVVTIRPPKGTVAEQLGLDEDELEEGEEAEEEGAEAAEDSGEGGDEEAAEEESES